MRIGKPVRTRHGALSVTLASVLAVALLTPPVDQANPLDGTAPPAGKPMYSAITSPGARRLHGAVEAGPDNLNVARYYSNQYTGRRFYTGVQWTF